MATGEQKQMLHELAQLCLEQVNWICLINNANELSQKATHDIVSKEYAINIKAAADCHFRVAQRLQEEANNYRNSFE